MDASAISRAPSARTIARLMTTGRDQLSKAETVTVAAIESGVEPLVEAREVVADFQAMIRRKAPAELDPYRARQDQPRCGVGERRHDSQSRGERRALLGLVQRPSRRPICKLKLVKRQMYGRGKLDLLQARVIGMM